MADSEVKASNGPHSPTTYSSSPELRNLAKATLSQLHFHSIGFSQLIEEDIDEDVLRALYAELGLPLPRKPARKRADDLTSNEESSQIQVPTKDQAPSSGKTHTVKKTPLDLRDLSVISSAEDATTSAPLPIIPKPALDSDKVHHIVKGHAPPKDVVTTQNNKPGIASILPRFNGSNGSNKSVTAKPQGNNTLERKDYIARMLAAKAGKPLAVKRSSPAPTMATSPDSNVVDKHQTNSEAQSSDPPNHAASVSSATTDADLEAKKRAQTELARQKMEALINRGTGQQVEPRKPIKQASAVVTQSPPLESSPQVLSRLQANLPVTAQLQASSLPSGLSPAPSTPWISVKALPETRNNGAVPPTPSSGIPGLFMTASAPLPLSISDESLPPVRQQIVPEASTVQSLSTTDLPPSQPTAIAESLHSDGSPTPLTHAESKGTINAVTNDLEKTRKRAKAADFIDGPAAKFRNPFGSGQPSRLIIEVSEDETNEVSDADTNEYLMDLDEDAKAGQYRNVPEVSVATLKQKSIRDLPPLSNFPLAKKPMLGSGVDTPPAMQTPGKGKEQDDLRRKEEQIELMNRKIAEMEQRRKAKQTASRAHTPGTPARSGCTSSPETSLAEASKQSQAVTEVVRMIDENTGELESQKTRLAVAEASMKEKLNIEQEARRAEVAKAENERVAAANAATSAELDQRRKRRAEIESGLPKLDAEVERTKSKLELMKKQMEELEAELQLGIQGRKTLMQELERLAMVPEEPPSAEPPVFLNDDTHLQPNNGVPVEQGQWFILVLLFFAL